MLWLAIWTHTLFGVVACACTTSQGPLVLPECSLVRPSQILTWFVPLSLPDPTVVSVGSHDMLDNFASTLSLPSRALALRLVGRLCGLVRMMRIIIHHAPRVSRWFPCLDLNHTTPHHLASLLQCQIVHRAYWPLHAPSGVVYDTLRPSVGVISCHLTSSLPLE